MPSGMAMRAHQPAGTPPIMMGPPAYQAPAPFVPTPPESPEKVMGRWGVAPKDLRGTGLDGLTSHDLAGGRPGTRSPGGGICYVGPQQTEEQLHLGRFAPGGLRKVAVVGA